MPEHLMCCNLKTNDDNIFFVPCLKTKCFSRECSHFRFILFLNYFKTINLLSCRLNIKRFFVITLMIIIDNRLSWFFWRIFRVTVHYKCGIDHGVWIASRSWTWIKCKFTKYLKHLAVTKRWFSHTTQTLDIYSWTLVKHRVICNNSGTYFIIYQISRRVTSERSSIFLPLSFVPTINAW